MTGEFLKKARDLPRPDRPFFTRVEIAKGCWPEILAVVEAAEMWAERSGIYIHNEEGLSVSLANRLSALNRKAGEL